MIPTDEKPFDRPVKLTGPSGAVEITSARMAADRLSDADWPQQDDAQSIALDTALKVLDGHRSTVDARDRFVEAARSAGILAGD